MTRFIFLYSSRNYFYDVLLLLIIGNAILFTHILIWLLSWFLPSLLSYLLIISSIYKEMMLKVDWKFLQNHTYKAIIFVSKWLRGVENFRFHSENLCFVIFHTQISINCEKYIIFLIRTSVCAQRSSKRTCLDFDTAMLLLFYKKKLKTNKPYSCFWKVCIIG